MLLLRSLQGRIFGKGASLERKSEIAAEAEKHVFREII